MKTHQSPTSPLKAIKRRYRALDTRNNLAVATLGSSILISQLSHSKYVRCLELKGSLALNAWSQDLVRCSKGPDFQLVYLPKRENLQQIVKGIIHGRLSDDLGVKFRINEPKEGQTSYVGYNAFTVFQLTLVLGSLRQSLPVTIWHPMLENSWPDDLEYPDCLNTGQVTKILVTQKEDMLADKLAILLEYGHDNSALKHYYDIYALAKLHDIDPPIVSEKLWRNLHQRQSTGYLMRADRYWEPSLLPTFADSGDNRTTWAKFRESQPLDPDIPTKFSEVIREVKAFGLPILDAVKRKHHGYPHYPKYTQKHDRVSIPRPPSSEGQPTLRM